VRDSVLDWLRKVALTPDYDNAVDGNAYEKLFPMSEVSPTDGSEDVDPEDVDRTKDRPDGGLFTNEQWENIPDEVKPTIRFYDRSAMEEQVRNVKAWELFKKTGQFKKPELRDEGDEGDEDEDEDW
jgi:hypothetical protein